MTRCASVCNVLDVSKKHERKEDIMATILHEGTCCTCCALAIANGDDSGCRDFHEHTHRAPSVTGRLKRQLDEQYGDPAGIDWASWAVVSGEDEEVMVGPCELCGEGGDYISGYAYSIIR